tara:strand:+ start:213 stop:521 length:309 start_codon:yes stop_codon:yes gene_type:complete
MSFIREHGGVGILTAEDVPDLQKGIHEAFLILQDGEWHSGKEIKERHSQGQGEALRRVRDLRPKLKPLGYTVEKRRSVVGRMFDYRIAKMPTAPFALEFTNE